MIGRASSVQLTNALDVLLRWTEDLDDERAVTLWAGLSAVEDPASREAALLRWVDWAGVTFPLGLKLRDLVTAVATLSDELERTVRDAERVYAQEPADLLPMTRALLGWMRARETQPGVVLGAARAIVLARKVLCDTAETSGAAQSMSMSFQRESFEVIPAAPGRERLSSREVAAALRDARGGDPLAGAQAMLFSALRRRIERAQVAESAELLLILLRAEQGDELPQWVLIALDFVLLEADLTAEPPAPIARLAHEAPALWSALIQDHQSPRASLRAMRLVTALSRHDALLEGLPGDALDALERSLLASLENPRWTIWARAARAFGHLAAIERLGLKLLAVLDEADSANVLRRRAFAALGNLSARCPPGLAERRDAVLDPLLADLDPQGFNASEASTIAALAVGLPDIVRGDDDDEWLPRALAFAARGGPEAWMVLGRAALEIRGRFPGQSQRVTTLATAVRARAETWQGGGVEAERAERAVALAARVMAAEELRAPATLLTDFAGVIGRVPTSNEARATVDGFAAELDVLVGNSARAISQDAPRTAARACMLLEEIVDLLVDGDLEVAAHRIADGGPRAAALSMTDALRMRLLKMMWSGLRRPTPSTFAWRRWLVRTAAVLPRVPPTNRRTAAPVVRDQVFETLERLSEDPLLSQPSVQRYVAGAISELSPALRDSLGANATVQILVWMCLRGAISERHLRMRRWLGEEGHDEAIDQLFALIETSTRPGRDVARDLMMISGLLGEAPGRLAKLVRALAAECTAVLQRRPETHWSGLARFDLSELASLTDTLRRCLDDVTFALTSDGVGASSTAPKRESLAERAAGLNRLLTATSLKFVDAARRAEIVGHYLGELSTLCEAIASSCGALLAPAVRGLLAKSLVTVRTLASEVIAGSEDDVRYIGRLKVLGELSSSHEGGMATTYLAEGPAPGKRVVLKLLPWERFRGRTAETARALFEGEMQRLAPIVHPNIVSIVDAGFIDEGAFIAVEYIPGASLETLLRKIGAVSIEHVGPVILDAARALAYLHARGVIHRDVKPANVLMQAEVPEGVEIDANSLRDIEFVRGVLIDFGIATEVDRAGPHEGVTGTPGYIAPEVARGLDTVGPGVDVYSLAVVIFEMLTGANPYLENQTELNAVLVAHATESPPWERLPRIPRREELIALLQDATRLDPRQRIQMKEFIARWAAFLR